jgi:hypothetical protein
MLRIVWICSLDFDQQVSILELFLEVLDNYQSVCNCLVDSSYRINQLQ